MHHIYLKINWNWFPIHRLETNTIHGAFAKVITLKNQGHQWKTNATIDFLDHKNMGLDIKIIVLSGLVQNLW